MPVEAAHALVEREQLPAREEVAQQVDVLGVLVRVRVRVRVRKSHSR